VATPGRLLDLMRRGAVSLKNTRFLVLDESDQMLDMGFAPDLKKIANELPLQRQTMLFSATMSRRMAEVASIYLKDPVRIEVARSGMTADKITQEIHYITKVDKMSKLTSLMKKHVGERTVIFGRTKHGMEKLCQRINHAGIKATSIHGNKTQAQRDRAIQAFKAGDIKVLVATDVAARGLDIPEVKHVYNYELPDKAENYIHRIGRTARAGEDGASISFCSVEEMSDLAAIEMLLGGPIPVASGTPWTVQRGERTFRRGAGGQRHDGNNSRRIR
jgi:ATP-dependent RNA helicase RhlE